jgi:hypothetical protein
VRQERPGRALGGAGDVCRHPFEPGSHPGIVFAPEPDEHLQHGVTVTQQRSPHRVPGAADRGVRREPPARLLMGEHEVEQPLDLIEVPGRDAHVRQKVEQVRGEGRAVMAGQPLTGRPVRQAGDQPGRGGIGEDVLARGLDLRIAGTPVQQGGQRDPARGRT